MSRNSLLSHFEPPEGYSGYFGLLCGYSADASCLNAVAERFTNLSETRRSVLGYPALVLMLDCGCSPLHTGVPGVFHLLAKDAKQPFALMHAKVGVLAFQHTTDEARWAVRLLVSTGNWTGQTVTQSLDLLWSLEVRSEDLNPSAVSDNVALACADIHASWDFLRWLSKYYDTRILTPALANTVPEITEHWNTYQTVLKQFSAKGKGEPRFIDNRKVALMEQLAPKIAEHTSETKRNYLAMGSGFFENTGDSTDAPETLNNIVKTLQDAGLLTTKPIIEIYVNKAECQGIAQAHEAINKKGWSICQPYTPSGGLRFLHAKFLFSAFDKANSPYCNSAWVYLGSGNLTKQGFGKAASTRGGNLEAGVVFSPGKVTWNTDADTSCPCISDLLPIIWDDEGCIEVDYTLLQAGEGFAEREERYFCAPVPYVVWDQARSLIVLPDFTEAELACCVCQPDGTPCPQCKAGFVWTAPRPSSVVLHWQENGNARSGIVPVLDTSGHMGAVVPPPNNLLELMDLLTEFPAVPENDDSAAENQEYTPSHPATSAEGAGTASDGRAAAHYPVRSVMMLIEAIAEKQTAILPQEWSRWCRRLEQGLVDIGHREEVLAIREQLRINPLSALYAEPFRPAFAVDASTDAGRLYERALHTIEQAWGLTDKPGLGGAQ